MNAYTKIQNGMKDAEKQVIKAIKEVNKEGRGFREILLGKSWRNAIERLEKRGKLQYKHKRNGWSLGLWVK